MWLQKQIIMKEPFTLEIVELGETKSYVLKIEDYRVQEDDATQFMQRLEEIIQTIRILMSRFEAKATTTG